MVRKSVARHRIASYRVVHYSKHRQSLVTTYSRSNDNDNDDAEAHLTLLQVPSKPQVVITLYLPFLNEFALSRCLPSYAAVLYCTVAAN